jgi:hypothetical protein
MCMARIDAGMRMDVAAAIAGPFYLARVNT